jgi:hypothetical protein
MPLVIQSTGSPGLKAVSFQSVTVSSTALALVIPEGVVPKRAFLSVEGQPIRYRTDGQNPTASVGHLLAAGGTLELIGAQAITSFRMIRQGTDSTVQYTIEI